MFDEDELLPISSLQHLLFCERQFALIHLDQLWADNRFTAEGEILHERVDARRHESRGREVQEFSLPVRSLELGLIGICDLVEITYNAELTVQEINPVEFKRGKTKPTNIDLVQLCAQALCLGEMLSLSVLSGQIYYLQEHRRSTIMLDDALIKQTKNIIIRCREILSGGVTPAALFDSKKCTNCSLIDLCLPKQTGNSKDVVSMYIKDQLLKNKGEE